MADSPFRLFWLPPEVAHKVGLAAIDLIPGRFWRRPAGASVSALGLQFPNAVGLAAGLDKDGEHIDGLAKLGFGFIEVGTVTPRPQPGNPRPRLFRLLKARALVNRMGFNNRGVDYLVARLRESAFLSHGGIVGVNIGKNFDTPAEQAANDYVHCLRAVYLLASYVAVNISSPNTRGLRDLQEQKQLAALLQALNETRAKLTDQFGRRMPIAVKIAPDLSDSAIERIGAVLIEQQMDAVIATNTTTSRTGVDTLAHGRETGGLSGAPLRQRSTAVVAVLARALAGRMPIIAAGGVMCGDDVREKFEAGATLVQLYTGIIYQGPQLVLDAINSVPKRPRSV